MINILEKYPIQSIILLVLLMLLPTLNILDVTIMEARNFITAREMLLDNNWILTTMNGEARYEKPPLPTWITAISGLIFGIKSTFGLRLPGIIMIAFTGIFIYLLSLQLLQNKMHSIINAFIAVTSFYIIGIAIEAPWDIYAHAFMLMAIYFLFQLFNKKPTLIFASIFLGFSILSKGPISLYGLFLPFIIAYAVTYKFTKKKILKLISAFILGIIIGGWWFIYVRYADADNFLELTNKETTRWANYNVKPFYYYWSFFTQSGLWTIPAFISLLYPYLKSRVSNLMVYRFSFFWTIFAVILLSIIPEKKSRYLMPVLIPLAINIGFYIEYLFRCFKNMNDKRETFPVYFNFGLIAFIGIAFPFVSYYFLKDTLMGYWVNYILASIALLTIGIFILIQLQKKRIKAVFFLTVLFFMFIFITALPLIKSTTSPNYKSISHLLEESAKQNIKVYSLNYVSPEMIWQFGDKIPQIKKADNSYDFPLENQFGMLTNDLTPKDEIFLKKLYTIKQVATFDLNQTKLSSKNKNNRLVSQYYILYKN